MSWEDIRGEAKNAIDAIDGGEAIADAVRKYHSAGAVAVYFCGACKCRADLELLKLFEQHKAGQVPMVEEQCQCCPGQLLFDGIQ